MKTPPFYSTAAFLLLLISWLLPPFESLWITIDETVFLFLNNAFASSLYWQNAIAWINSRYGDWLYEGIILFLYLTHIITGDKKKWGWRFITTVLAILFTQVLINKILFFKIFDAHRLSPSYILEHPLDLSVFPYPNNKVFSSHSFPADHATTLFLVSFFAWSHFKKPLAISVSILSLVMVFPRLISGAHWLSDIIFGACYIAMIGWWTTFVIMFYVFEKRKKS